MLHSQAQTLVLARPYALSHLGPYTGVFIHLGHDPQLILTVHPDIQHLADLPVPIVIIQDGAASHRLPGSFHASLGQLGAHIVL